MESKNPTVLLEWLYETLNKRVGPPYNCKLSDLFLVVPYNKEAEFLYELTDGFEGWRREGNDMARDYPNLYKILGHSRKSSSIRVFFVHPSRCEKNLILHIKKYKYPRISKVKKSYSRIDSQIEFVGNQKILRMSVN